MSEIEVTDLCIVCNKAVSSNDFDTKKDQVVDPLENAQGSKEGKPHYEFSRSTELLAKETETDLLLPQLRVIFLLKQFFKVPLQEERATVQMLGDPVKWCEICRNCQVLVDTGITLLRKIRKCEEEHRRVLGELRSKFKLSNNIEYLPKNPVIVRKENVRRREFRNRVRDALLPICSEIKEETEWMPDSDVAWDDPMDDTAFEPLDWSSTSCKDEVMWDHAKEADPQYFPRDDDKLEGPNTGEPNNVAPSEARRLFRKKWARQTSKKKKPKISNTKRFLMKLEAQYGPDYANKVAFKVPPTPPSKKLSAKKEPLKRPVKKPPRPLSKYQRLKNAQEQESSSIELIPDEDIKEEPDPIEVSKEPGSLDAPLDSPSGIEVIHDDGGDDAQKEIENLKEIFKDPNYRPGIEVKYGERYRRSRLNAQRKKVSLAAKRLKQAHMMRRTGEERALQPKRPCKKKPPPQDVESGQKFLGGVGRPPKWNQYYDNCHLYLNLDLFAYPAETKLEKLRIPRTGTCPLLEEREVRKSKFPCPVCPKYFCDRYFAIAHIQRVHFGILKPWKCNQCQHTGSRFRDFIRKHLKLHEISGGLKTCPVCGFSVKNAGTLEKHVIGHQRNVANPSCVECNKTFSDFRTYVGHMTNTHGYAFGKSMKMCEYCSFTTPKSKTLDFHRLVKHNVGSSNDGRFPICSDCGQMFSSEETLKNHTARSHDGKEGSFCCEFCGKEYKWKADLSSHVKSAHTNPPDTEPIPCQICGMIIVGAQKHRSHVLRLHAETRSMSVEELDEYVKKKNEEEKPFQCSQCVEKFSFRHLLYHHYRTCHPEVTDKFKCTVCGKGFSRQCSVKRHYESAHMKVEQSCDLCGRKCTSRDGIAQHKSKHCPVLKKQQEEEPASSSTQVPAVVENPEDGINVPHLNTQHEMNQQNAVQSNFSPQTINIPFQQM